jgi:hypothetical protein
MEHEKAEEAVDDQDIPCKHPNNGKQTRPTPQDPAVHVTKLPMPGRN